MKIREKHHKRIVKFDDAFCEVIFPCNLMELRDLKKYLNRYLDTVNESIRIYESGKKTNDRPNHP